MYETAIEQRENWKELAEGRGQQKWYSYIIISKPYEILIEKEDIALAIIELLIYSTLEEIIEKNWDVYQEQKK